MKRLIILLFFLALLAIPANAQTASITAEVEGVQDFWMVKNVEEGKYIRLVIKVGVHDVSPKALDGFWVKVIFTKPSGQTITKWYDFTNEYISRGTERIYEIKTDVVADEVGTWKVTVELYDKTRTYRINYDEETFQVSYTLPAAYVNISSITGYSLLGSMMLGAVYILMRKGVIKL